MVLFEGNGSDNQFYRFIIRNKKIYMLIPGNQFYRFIIINKKIYPLILDAKSETETRYGTLLHSVLVRSRNISLLFDWLVPYDTNHISFVYVETTHMC